MIRVIVNPPAEPGVRQEAEPTFACGGRAESLRRTGRKPAVDEPEACGGRAESLQGTSRKPTVDEPKAYREPWEVGG